MASQEHLEFLGTGYYGGERHQYFRVKDVIIAIPGLDGLDTKIVSEEAAKKALDKEKEIKEYYTNRY
jgi:hypothetical protein